MLQARFWLEAYFKKKEKKKRKKRKEKKRKRNNALDTQQQTNKTVLRERREGKETGISHNFSVSRNRMQTDITKNQGVRHISIQGFQ